MIEVRWHGRGGQGAVTAAELLARAAFADGKQAQAFPAFGPERRGAPVTAFTRINDKPIRIRQQVYTPDIAIVFDPTLMKAVNVLSGLKENGIIIINTDEKPDIKTPQKVFTVNAKQIALETIGKPIVNSAMLGATVKATQAATLESVLEAVRERFGEKNVQACERAFKECSQVEP